jgi:mevalonate kinase
VRSMVIAVPVAALVLVAAGCGGSSSSSAGDTTATVASVDTSASTDTSVSTDMTSTDTGATDTGATDTGATDTTAGTDTTTTTSGGNASFAGCKKLIDLSGKYSQVIAAATSANGKTNFETIAKAYKAFAEEVPEEIRGAFRTLAEAFSSYAEAFKGIDLSSGKTPDPATLAKLANAAKSLDNKKLTAATAEIEAWGKKNCKTG